MKKYIFILFSSFIFISCHSVSKTQLSSKPKPLKTETTADIINTLASDEFMGRSPGSKYYDKSVSYVTSFLKNNNIKPFYKNGYLDTCQYFSKKSYNIVALIGDRNRDKEHILIGAHLDHLGTSNKENDSIYNGANDDASGVAAVLQIAKELNKYQFDQNIIIALFTGEESGFIGSKHLAKRLKNEGIKLSYMLNFEMLGKTLTSGKDQVYITGYYKSNLASEANKIMKRKYIKYLPDEKKYQLFYMADNISFYKEFNIPSHTISTFDFKNDHNYHTESDEASQLDMDNLNEVIKSSTFLIQELLKNKTQIIN